MVTLLLSYVCLNLVVVSQRLNVAITRSKFALWIVGHVPTLNRDKEWAKLIEFAAKKGFVLAKLLLLFSILFYYYFIINLFSLLVAMFQTTTSPK